MTWRVARSLDVLLAEVNAAAPNRSKISDGSIGDAAHASRDSDHNPWRRGADGMPVVGARDFTHDPADGLDCNKLASSVAALLGKHSALGSGAYVIWNRRIISRDRLGEGWRAYTGSNPHDKHCHVSVCTSPAGFDSTAPWNVFAKPVPPKPPKPTRGERVDHALDDLDKAVVGPGRRGRLIRRAKRLLRRIKPTVRR